MPLLNLPVPDLIPAQLDKFNAHSIRAKESIIFRPITLLDYLKKMEGKQVIAVDIGGDKMASVTSVVKSGNLVRLRNPAIFESEQGAGYLGQLEDVAQLANQYSLSVGLSFPGIVENGQLIEEPNVKIFERDLKNKYAGYFTNFFHQIAVENDAVSGLLAGSVEAIKKYPEMENVVFVINGSGVNTSVLKIDQVYASESGHVEALIGLNKFKRQKACKMQNAKYVCIENITGSKAGVEETYFEQTQNNLSGLQISNLLINNDSLATQLYDISALGLSHMIVGVCQALDLLNVVSKTVIVCHGGIFNVPEYPDRLKQIVQKNQPKLDKWVFTKDFTDNASLDGAAIAALYFGI